MASAKVTECPWGTPRQRVEPATTDLRKILDEAIATRSRNAEIDARVAATWEVTEVPQEADVDADLALAMHMQQLEDAKGKQSQNTIVTAEADPNWVVLDESGTERLEKIPDETLNVDADLAYALHVQALEREEYERNHRQAAKESQFSRVRTVNWGDMYDAEHRRRAASFEAADLENDSVMDPDEEEIAANLACLATGESGFAPSQKSRTKGSLFYNEDGELVSKHDAKICGKKNARDLERTHNVVSGNVLLSNKVANSFKEGLRKEWVKGVRVGGKVESSKRATSDRVLDERTRLILLKLVNAGILEGVNGSLATGKEANVYHGVWTGEYNKEGAWKLGDEAVAEDSGASGKAPCAVKIFRTTLNSFSNRAEYVEGDHRYPDQRFAKKTSKEQVNAWAEKEMANLIRISRAGIPAPRPIVHKDHVLVMSFIGKEDYPAPQLRLAELPGKQALRAYMQIVNMTRALYEKAKLVHADLSEYNVLYLDKQCYMIDVGQAVDVSSHPRAHSFLEKDCENITNFFVRKHKVPLADERMVGVLPVSVYQEYVEGKAITSSAALATIQALRNDYRGTFGAK